MIPNNVHYCTPLAADIEDPCSTYKSDVRDDFFFSKRLLDLLFFPTLVMLLSAGLAPLVLLVAGVIADPSLARDSLITVPISKRTDFNAIPDFTKRDRERLRQLVERSSHRRQSSTVSKAPDIPLNNTGGIYVATIGVGNPATNCEFCKFLS
jgi:hypothetical protein